MTSLCKLGTILGIGSYRRVVIAITVFYWTLFLIAIQDVSPGGRGFQFLSTEWSRMFERTGAATFEPVARLTLPGLTFLISPLNMAIGLVVSVLAGLNLAVTYLAFRQPKACGFNRSTGILASVPALLAGSACCAPAIILILGLQLSSLLVSVFQVLIPLSVLALLVTLKLILDRTNPESIAA